MNINSVFMESCVDIHILDLELGGVVYQILVSISVPISISGDYRLCRKQQQLQQ